MNTINKFDLVLEIIRSLPNKTERTMKRTASHPTIYNRELCEQYQIPFLPDFVDIDSYIKENQTLRLQGYIDVSISMFGRLDETQLKFILALLKNGEVQYVEDFDLQKNRVEIWIQNVLPI